MGVIDYELLNWSNLLGWPLLLIVAVGLAVIAMVALRPRWFWPLLIMSAILGNLPRLRGYILFDEVLLGAVVLGAFMVLAVAKVRRETFCTDKLHLAVFSLWIGYMLVQSLRGVLVDEDSRLMRWVFLYAMLGLVPFVASTKSLRYRDPRQLITIALLSALLGWIIYVAQGVYFESQTPFGKFLSGNKYIAGTAYATFPMVLAVPASLIFLFAAHSSLRLRLLAWSILIINVVVALYFDSRISWLVMAAFLAVALLKARGRRIIVACVLVFAVIYALMVPQPQKQIPAFWDSVYETSQALWNPQPTDLSRNLQAKVGFATIGKDWSTFLFGYGVNSHKTVIVPYIQRMFVETPPETPAGIPGMRDDMVPWLKLFRTTGFNAFLIDTGIIGILLLGMNFLLVARRVIAQKSQTGLLALVILPVIAGWLFVANIQDIVLFYLLFMPHGPVEMLSQIPMETRGVRTGGAPVRGVATEMA